MVFLCLFLYWFELDHVQSLHITVYIFSNKQLCLFFTLLFLQAAHEKDKVLEEVVVGEITEAKESYVDNRSETKPVQSLSSQMNELAVSTNPKTESASSEPIDDPQFPSNDLDKRIRALKKKVKRQICVGKILQIIFASKSHENLSIHCMQNI